MMNTVKTDTKTHCPICEAPKKAPILVDGVEVCADCVRFSLLIEPKAAKAASKPETREAWKLSHCAVCARRGDACDVFVRSTHSGICDHCLRKAERQLPKGTSA